MSYEPFVKLCSLLDPFMKLDKVKSRNQYVQKLFYTVYCNCVGMGHTWTSIVELTGGGAHLSIEALGIAATTNASIECLRPLGRHVQIGMPVGHTARMEINMNAVYMKNLALFGTRGMPSWRYPSLLSLIEAGRVDFTPLVAREVTLSGASAELRAFNGPTAPGVAVITDFSA